MQKRVVLKNCGIIDSRSIHSFLKRGGFAALEKAQKRMTPEEVIKEVTASGLLGRGGAGFPTGIKWEGAAAAPGSPKYIVCNADESEPGTFKDRVLLLDDPHTLIEGMAIAGHAVGAERGYIYLRGEYAYILPVLEAALIEATKDGRKMASVASSA